MNTLFIDGCLSCGIEYRHDSNADFVCGTCVQIYISKTQAELKAAQEKAIKKQDHGKIVALSLFIGSGMLPEKPRKRKIKISNDNHKEERVTLATC